MTGTPARRARKTPRTDKADSTAAVLAKIAAPHQLIESAWYFTGLDDASEAKLSAIIRQVAN